MAPNKQHNDNYTSPNNHFLHSILIRFCLPLPHIIAEVINCEMMKRYKLKLSEMQQSRKLLRV